MRKHRVRFHAGLVLPLLVAGIAFGAPATPAVPGGGNPYTDNPNAATPAIPGGGNPLASPVAESPPGLDDMDDRDAGDLMEQHAGLGNQAREKWMAMTPGERAAFVKERPAMPRRLLKRDWGKWTPAQRAMFVRGHPELKLRLAQAWRDMNPEMRRAFLDRHPRTVKAAARRNRDHRAGRADHGVRDRGAGEGRGGIGQGGEHREEGVRDMGGGAPGAGQSGGHGSPMGRPGGGGMGGGRK